MEINSIPKVIHYCWVGGKPLTPLAEKCIASWQRVMPDYEIKRWDESNYDFKKNKFMANAYKQKKWGFVPDYARLDIIYNYGGIYFDTDVETLKSFDEFLKYPAFCGFESEHFVALGLVFGAQKGNKIIKRLMQPYENMDFKISDNILKQVSLYTKIKADKWQKEGFIPSPLLQTQFLTENYGLKQNNTRQSLGDIEIFPSSYFAPKNNANLPIKTDSAYSVHWYASSWLPWYYKIYLKVKRKLFK
ncbi:MAG: glycosyl transferase [Elusimicrobiaceae bacterium]|nr:glycosyl transferase [Elusimicrobiaceae bacterium]